MKKFLPLAALCTLLLTSCVFYPHLGQRIREPGEVYTGVSLRPVDGKIYELNYSCRDVDGKLHHKARYYARVPELTFCRKSQLFYSDDILKSAYLAPAYNIRPTGRILVAQFQLNNDDTPEYVIVSEGFREELPKGARLSHTLSSTDTLPLLAESYDYPHTKASWPRRIAAAPFDYLIDPALKTIFYTGEAVGLIALIPFAGVYQLVDRTCGQQQTKAPALADEQETN